MHRLDGRDRSSIAEVAGCRGQSNVPWSTQCDFLVPSGPLLPPILPFAPRTNTLFQSPCAAPVPSWSRHVCTTGGCTTITQRNCATDAS